MTFWRSLEILWSINSEYVEVSHPNLKLADTLPHDMYMNYQSMLCLELFCHYMIQVIQQSLRIKFLDNDVASLKSNWWMSITKGELISKFWSQSRVCFKRKIMAGVWISLVLKINIDKLNLKILSLNHGNIYMIVWIVLIALKEIRNKTCEDPIIGLLWMPNFMLIYIFQLKCIKKRYAFTRTAYYFNLHY